MPRSCSFHQTSAALRTKWQRDPDTRNVTVISALLRVSTNQPPRASAVGELANFPQTSWSQQAEQNFPRVLVSQENPWIHMFFCNLLPWDEHVVLVDISSSLKAQLPSVLFLQCQVKAAAVARERL